MSSYELAIGARYYFWCKNWNPEPPNPNKPIFWHIQMHIKSLSLLGLCQLPGSASKSQFITRHET